MPESQHIEKITSACAAAGCPKPTFVLDQGGLMLIFPEPAWLKDVAPEASGQGLSEPGSESSSERGTETTSTRQAILKAMRADPTITGEALAQAIGISQRAVEKAIRDLRESGSTRRVGGRSAGHWEVLIGPGAKPV